MPNGDYTPAPDYTPKPPMSPAWPAKKPLETTPVYSGAPPSIGTLLEAGRVGEAAQIGLEQTLAAAQPAPEGKLGFNEWLEMAGMTDAFLGGSTKIKEDIYNNYIGYLTGAPGVVGAPTGAGVGAAVVPPIFSPEEERTLVDLQNLMKIGEIDEDQAWKILENYWAEEAVRLGRAQEVTTRGAQELGYWQDIYRSVGPTPTLPRPEGLGFGVPPLQGIPVSQLPQPGEIFGQAQQQMGLPGQLPAIQAPDLGLPNWRALLENMPTFGPTGNTYIDELLREGRSTAPAL